MGQLRPTADATGLLSKIALMATGSRSALAIPRPKARPTVAAGAAITESFRFAPEVGRWRTHLIRLVRLAKRGQDELRAYLASEAGAVLAEASDPAL